MQTVISGYRKAAAAARERLAAVAFGVEDEGSLRQCLLSVARTTLSSKLLTHDKVNPEAFSACFKLEPAVVRAQDMPENEGREREDHYTLSVAFSGQMQQVLRSILCSSYPLL